MQPASYKYVMFANLRRFDALWETPHRLNAIFRGQIRRRFSLTGQFRLECGLSAPTPWPHRGVGLAVYNVVVAVVDIIIIILALNDDLLAVLDKLADDDRLIRDIAGDAIRIEEIDRVEGVRL